MKNEFFLERTRTLIMKAGIIDGDDYSGTYISTDPDIVGAIGIDAKGLLYYRDDSGFNHTSNIKVEDITDIKVVKTVEDEPCDLEFITDTDSYLICAKLF